MCLRHDSHHHRNLRRAGAQRARDAPTASVREGSGPHGSGGGSLCDRGSAASARVHMCRSQATVVVVWWCLFCYRCSLTLTRTCFLTTICPVKAMFAYDDGTGVDWPVRNQAVLGPNPSSYRCNFLNAHALPHAYARGVLLHSKHAPALSLPPLAAPCSLACARSLRGHVRLQEWEKKYSRRETGAVKLLFYAFNYLYYAFI